MRFDRYYILLILSLLCAMVAHAQESRTEIQVDFRVSSIVIDSTYSDNAARMQELLDFLRTVREDHTITIVEIAFRGTASPEGSAPFNCRLAKRRLAALESLVRKNLDIPDSLITRNDTYIPWDYLKAQVEASDLPRKEEVLAILEEGPMMVNDRDNRQPTAQVDHRIVKLKALDGGRVWQQMNRLFFERMHNACAVFVTFRKQAPAVRDTVVMPHAVAVVPVADSFKASPDTATAVVSAVVAPEAEVWGRRLHVKTNAIGLGMGVLNVAAEMDITYRWSYALSVYHCAWNYVKSTIKFRVFSVYPEMRYWLSENNEGVFAGAHLGMVFYNFAFDGAYRYQRHHRRIPAMGGGLSVGYRMPVSKDSRWQVEFALGAGVYPLHYDRFYNTSHTKDGLLVDSRRKTYIGIDQAAISLSYTFDLWKKGGRR